MYRRKKKFCHRRFFLFSTRWWLMTFSHNTFFYEHACIITNEERVIRQGVLLRISISGLFKALWYSWPRAELQLAKHQKYVLCPYKSVLKCCFRLSSQFYKSTRLIFLYQVSSRKMHISTFIFFCSNFAHILLLMHYNGSWRKIKRYLSELTHLAILRAYYVLYIQSC